MVPKFAFFQGQIVPFDQAKVSVMTHALNYGTGCFEGIRAYWNEEEEQLYVLKMQEHYQRFMQNWRLLCIDLDYSVEDLESWTVELLRREGYEQDTYIRPLAYKSETVIGVRLHNLEDDLTIFAEPFGRYIQKEEGASICTSSWRRISDTAIPARGKIAGAYVNSAFIKTEAVLNGFDEAIVLNQDGHVSEGSAENLFIVRDGVLITPPVSANILEGITRAAVIQLAREELGMEVVERPIDRTEFYVADEAFFCGTGAQVTAIASVDHRSVGTGGLGSVVRQLREVYFGAVRGKLPRYRSWLTPVYEA
ncbi:MAG: branched-chain amino acid transaminase [Chloroflexota bacterium]|nr:branched-chain amino acid transaminase [Chloroflexota bacterium]